MDTTNWFRPPAFYEYAPPADFIWYMWSAEPTDPSLRPDRTPEDRYCFGVSWMVTDQLIYEASDPQGLHTLLKLAGLRELYRRVNNPSEYGQPEGSLVESFLWNPILQRHEDGTITVKETT